eukprot:CAMPEP_0168343014 /NCGR_PEP_ID=MMETSP0213-20121227/15780_1 /TAXON_ID=151035 /ORGANISM="Euplotes harpa, Strain FSP1.4" /LENGTH=59 /DNA_ID=CAMNT_0008350107 /DNA_START=39 /DNA_END=218 /DNA_ORIENTATION=-
MTAVNKRKRVCTSRYLTKKAKLSRDHRIGFEPHWIDAIALFWHEVIMHGDMNQLVAMIQ